MAKILLVDDDPDFVDATKLILEKSGHKISVANNGKDGWDKAQKENPDLLLVDVMMESPDAGFQLVYKLKNDPKLKNKPVLLLTAVGKVTGFKFDKQKDQDFMPVTEYLEKPIKPEVLLDKISKALGK
jgi:CheY-like chemotaxis protein